MKKVFSILMLVALMVTLGACTKSDEDYNTHQIQGEVLNNSVSIADGQSVQVTTSAISMVWNVNEATLSVNYTAAITDNTTATVSLKDVPLEPNVEYSCYTFSAADGGNSITNLKGYYRPGTGCLYIEFVYNGTHRVMTSSNLYYPYLTYNITNSETGETKESPYGALVIDINPKDMSAQMAMGEFALSEVSGIITQVVFYGLHAEATATGYKVTYSGDQRSTDGSYTLNEFEAIISGSGQVVNGTFTINDKYNGTLAGKAFAN